MMGLSLLKEGPDGIRAYKGLLYERKFLKRGFWFEVGGVKYFSDGICDVVLCPR